MYAFLYSDVLFTLLVMGLVLLPVLFNMWVGWTRDGYDKQGLPLSGVPVPSAGQLVKAIAYAILVLTLGSAIAASLCIQAFGWLFGTALFVLVFVLLVVRKNGLLHRQISLITQDDRV